MDTSWGSKRHFLSSIPSLNLFTFHSNLGLPSPSSESPRVIAGIFEDKLDVGKYFAWCRTKRDQHLPLTTQQIY